MSPSFGNIWDTMGYQPMIVNRLFLAVLAKKPDFIKNRPS